MPANATFSVSSAISPAATRVPSVDTRDRRDAGSAFDSHLDAARQQHGASSTTAEADQNAGARGASDAMSQAHAAHEDDAAQTPASAAAMASTKAKASAAVDQDQGAKSADSDDKAIDAGTLSVAGAMLALLGQAMPASASAATGGAAKVLAASGLKVGAGTLADNALGADAAAAPLDADADAGVETSFLPTATVETGKDFKVLAQALAGSAAGPADTRKVTDTLALKDLGSLLAGTAQPTTSSAAAPHALHIASPAGSAAFAQELGQQVAWIGKQDIKEAKIRLHPEDLGQLDVKVNLQHNGQVDVTFAAQHPAAVHALQQTLPQLDALLAQHGLSLGQANVSQQQSGGDGQSGRSSRGGDSEAVGGVDAPGDAPASISAVGLLDAFA